MLLAVNKDDPNDTKVVYTSDKLELRTVNGELVGVDRDGKATKLYEVKDQIAPDYRVITRENENHRRHQHSGGSGCAVSSDNAKAGATVQTRKYLLRRPQRKLLL